VRDNGFGHICADADCRKLRVGNGYNAWNARKQSARARILVTSDVEKSRLLQRIEGGNAFEGVSNRIDLMGRSRSGVPSIGSQSWFARRRHALRGRFQRRFSRGSPDPATLVRRRSDTVFHILCAFARGNSVPRSNGERLVDSACQPPRMTEPSKPRAIRRNANR